MLVLNFSGIINTKALNAYKLGRLRQGGLISSLTDEEMGPTVADRHGRVIEADALSLQSRGRAVHREPGLHGRSPAPPRRLGAVPILPPSKSSAGLALVIGDVKASPSSTSREEAGLLVTCPSTTRKNIAECERRRTRRSTVAESGPRAHSPSLRTMRSWLHPGSRADDVRCTYGRSRWTESPLRRFPPPRRRGHGPT